MRREKIEFVDLSSPDPLEFIGKWSLAIGFALAFLAMVLT